ncbi:MAG TPA: radical SAM protein [Candidatus Hydrogenedentes bacterium]|nr:radical SAM protein [Candidatus Hydrogenedentota bacterium]
MSKAVKNKRNLAALSLVAANIRRGANVIVSRYLRRPPRYLPVILLFVTERCNLHCRMCGVCERPTAPSVDDELTFHHYKSLIETASARLGTTLVSIGGGEPLLRRDIFDIIRCAADAGMSVHICTNGLLINRERAVNLRDSGIAAVSISLDSPDAASHEYLRGSGTFEATIDAIQLLREVAPEIQVGINYLITRLNFHNMETMVGLAEHLGVQQIKFAPIHMNLLHRHKAEEEFRELFFSESDLPELREEILRLKKRCRKSFLSTTSPAFFDGIVPFYQVARRSFRCYAGYAICAVGPTGQVAPCCDMDSPFSVKDTPIDVLWRDPAFHELRGRVDRCSARCWDTTNTELSLTLRPWSLLGHIVSTWRDLRFYSGMGRK